MELNNIRAKIDDIDDRLSALFVERMTTVAEVALNKRKTGKAIRDRAREREVINHVTLRTGEEYAPYIKDLYKLIFELSCNYEASLMVHPSSLAEQIQTACAHCEGKKLPNRALVAVQGTEGAYGQQACERMFEYPDILYFDSFDGVFNAVEKGMCEFGVLPIENSTAGSVTQVYDLMEKHSFHIVGARKLRIDHCLMRRTGASGPIREVVSHEQALRQCSGFFERNPEYEPVAMANTAIAAEFAASTPRDDIAVIASSVCAELYDLEIVESNISNTPSNYTRFICISRECEIYPSARKVSIMLNVPHEPGSLSRILSRLAIGGVNVCKLESRPMPGLDGEYRFFFDLEADLHDERMVQLLCELEARTQRFVFLGGYDER
ncbi:MAG: chorismate mutase [Clostridia bacterium]|nr:chorismate mutase [Clostridia bacterium]